MPDYRVRYQTIEFGEVDIHLRTLRDLQQFSDHEGEAEALGISSALWPIFGVVWQSGHALAHMMLNYELKGRRILEVGCGIGLASLVLNGRQADISATDRHPEAQGFLDQNAALNDGPQIPFERVDWLDLASDLGRFDLIIGSDLLYEAHHAKALSAFIDEHANPACEVLLVGPGRGNRGRFIRCMEALGYEHSQGPVEGVAEFNGAFAGRWERFERAGPLSPLGADAPA